MSRPRCVKDSRRELAHHECPGGKTHNKGNLWEGLRVDGFYDIPRHDARSSGRGVHGLPYGISLAFRCRQSAPQPDRDPYDPKREEGIACGVWARVGVGMKPVPVVGDDTLPQAQPFENLGFQPLT